MHGAILIVLVLFVLGLAGSGTAKAAAAVFAGWGVVNDDPKTLVGSGIVMVASQNNPVCMHVNRTSSHSGAIPASLSLSLDFPLS